MRHVAPCEFCDEAAREVDWEGEVVKRVDQLHRPAATSMNGHGLIGIQHAGRQTDVLGLLACRVEIRATTSAK